MDWTQKDVDVCRDALYLLRHDIEMPAPEDAATDTQLEWVKCRLSYPAARTEVLGAHDWAFARDAAVRDDVSAWPDDVVNCLVYALARRLSVPIAGRTADMQSYNALYQDALARAVQADLTHEFEEDPDPVLYELVQNFTGDQQRLVRSYGIYRKRADVVKRTAALEISKAHNWRTAFQTEGEEGREHVAYGAWLALCVSKLAVPCGLGEAVQVFEGNYQRRLRAARVADLESTPVAKGLHTEVLAFLHGLFEADGELPRDMKSLTDRIDAIEPIARLDVLSSHDWSFAYGDDGCETAPVERPDPIYPHHFTLPYDCLAVGAVYGEDGRLSQWKLRGREIHARGRVTRIVYVRDVTDYAQWHPKAYRALVLHIASDLAKTIASSPKERQYQEQVYRDALEDAKACDTRESNTPDEAWGRNEIADRMLFGRRADDPLFRD